MDLMNHVRNFICQKRIFNQIQFVFQDDGDYSPDPTERYDMPATKSKEQEFDKRVLINRTRPERCDKVITLYKLYRERTKEEKADKEMTASCDRPFIVVPIPSSNMILVIASTLCSRENQFPFVNLPVEKHYNASSLQCYKLKNFPTHRRHLKHCFNKHQNESQIELCGKASKFYISFYMLSLVSLVMIKNLSTNF
jgi:voltage-dependent calcium channel alpha-2/delta-3